MNKSESINKIAPALLSAQREIGAAIKGSTNPFFKKKYADLGSVMESCKDALNKNGITVLQPVGIDTVETILLHESGEWISETMNITAKSDNNPQDQGSAITYARRYSLQSMVFIPAEDDDGNKATPRSTKYNSPSTKPASPVKAPVNKTTPKKEENVLDIFDGEAPVVKAPSLRQIEAVIKIAKQNGEELTFEEVRKWTPAKASDYIGKRGNGGFYKAKETANAAK